MKYIRTKDGRIWEIIESDDETGTFVIKIPNDKQQEYDLLKEVLL